MLIYAIGFQKKTVDKKGKKVWEEEMFVKYFIIISRLNL